MRGRVFVDRCVAFWYGLLCGVWMWSPGYVAIAKGRLSEEGISKTSHMVPAARQQSRCANEPSPTS